MIGRAHARWAGLFLAGALLALALPVSAQYADLDRADWKEDTPPPPPAYNVNRLIEIEMPRTSSIKMGLDPDTIRVNAETGIVRYVVVARNATGSVTAIYEGIRCSTGEVKTYARAGNTGVWSVVAEPQWRGLTDNLPSKHAWVFARQAACDGRAAAASNTADIVRALQK